MTLTRTVSHSAGSVKTAQIMVTGQDTKVQPRHLALALAETTLMEVSPCVFLNCSISLTAFIGNWDMTEENLE